MGLSDLIGYIEFDSYKFDYYKLGYMVDYWLDCFYYVYLYDRGLLILIDIYMDFFILINRCSLNCWLLHAL